ncbi:MAG: hypothetical protein JW751_05330 [Polyangiaceae bacterium]|nr:hypothetical protein [Polyangiaceae bacterium]
MSFIVRTGLANRDPESIRAVLDLCGERPRRSDAGLEPWELGRIADRFEAAIRSGRVSIRKEEPMRARVRLPVEPLALPPQRPADDVEPDQREVEILVQDCQGTPVRGALVQAIVDQAALASGTTGGDGRCLLAFHRSERPTLKVTEIDETQLAEGDPEAAELAETAYDLRRGVAFPARSSFVVTVLLLDLEFTLEETQIDAPARMAHLRSHDGVYDRRLDLPPARDDEFEQHVLFTGLPTIGKRFTLKVLEQKPKPDQQEQGQQDRNHQEQEQERVVFEDLTLPEIIGLIEEDQERLALPDPHPERRRETLAEADANWPGSVPCSPRNEALAQGSA